MESSSNGQTNKMQFEHNIKKQKQNAENDQEVSKTQSEYSDEAVYQNAETA
jgi:hypothetical protein